MENVTIRYPQEGDAKIMCDYINALSAEKTFIKYQGEKISLKEEEKYLKGQLERINKKETVRLLLFAGDKLVGVSSVELMDKIESHIGVLGISILNGYRGKGFGKLLMKRILEEAAKMPKLKIVTLDVFAINERAANMYKSFGFIEYGRLPNGVQYKGKLVDEIKMYKSLI